MKQERLTPKVIVDYIREPYVYAAGNVRITFDRNIRASFCIDPFLSPDCPTMPVSMANTVLMEVKYDDYMPDIVQMCIQEGERQQEAFSKYAACRRYG